MQLTNTYKFHYLYTNFYFLRCKIKIQVNKKSQYDEHTLSTFSKNAQTHISLTLNSFASYNLSPIHYIDL